MIATNSLPIKVSNDLIHSYYYNEFNQKKRYNSGVVVDDACYELMFVKEKNVNLINGQFLQKNHSCLIYINFILHL